MTPHLAELLGLTRQAADAARAGEAVRLLEVLEARERVMEAAPPPVPEDEEALRQLAGADAALGEVVGEAHARAWRALEEAGRAGAADAAYRRAAQAAGEGGTGIAPAPATP